jgi:hypothetical protein
MGKGIKFFLRIFIFVLKYYQDLSKTPRFSGVGWLMLTGLGGLAVLAGEADAVVVDSSETAPGSQACAGLSSAATK